MKYIKPFMVVALAVMLGGCLNEALEVIEPFVEKPEGGGNSMLGNLLSAFFGTEGALGAAGITILLSLKERLKRGAEWKEAAEELGKDAYEEFKSLSEKDKKALDAKIRKMVPEKYQKYYDAGKELL